MTQVWLDASAFDAAITYWESRLKEKPNDPEIMGNLAGINLKAGCRYYLEYIQKEGGGGDNGGVAWQTPAGGPVPGVPADECTASGGTPAGSGCCRKLTSAPSQGGSGLYFSYNLEDLLGLVPPFRLDGP